MNQLPGIFFSCPQYASTVITKEQMQKLFQSIPDYSTINNRVWLLVRNRIGSGMYKISLKPWDVQDLDND
jgi:hypothetical protein